MHPPIGTFEPRMIGPDQITVLVQIGVRNLGPKLGGPVSVCTFGPYFPDRFEMVWSVFSKYWFSRTGTIIYGPRYLALSIKSIFRLWTGPIKPGPKFRTTDKLWTGRPLIHGLDALGVKEGRPRKLKIIDLNVKSRI